MTIRPLNGVREETLAALREWGLLQHKCVMVTEMEGVAKHVHCQVWYPKGKARGDMCKAMQRICERTIDDFNVGGQQIKCLRQGVRIAYSDWHMDYLIDNAEKEEPGVVIIEDPPDSTDEYYPSEEEQQAVQAKKNAVDQKYHGLAVMFHEWYDGVGFIDISKIAKFLAVMEFEEKRICVMKDKMTRINTAKNLLYYIQGSAPRAEYITKEEEEVQLQFDEIERNQTG